MLLADIPPKGSSPLARGTPAQFHGATARYGLIPARAGNTLLLVSVQFACWAHPRSRGEHTACQLCLNVEQGSSPLARGTPKGTGGFSGCVGLIPARAGNTGSRYKALGYGGAHPRSRGEHWRV